MLKSVQILGSSSGFLSLVLKKSHNSCYGLSFVAVSTNPLPYSTTRRHESVSKTDSLVSPAFLTRRTRCFRASRVCATRSESNQDATSSHPSSAAVHSAVSFFLVVYVLNLNGFHLNYVKIFNSV